MKPRLSPADAEAYRRISTLKVGTAVSLDGRAGVFEGMSGYLIALKLRGRNVLLRAGNPAIARIEISSDVTLNPIREDK